MTVVRIGLDIAKLVFQAYGVDEHGKLVLKKTLCQITSAGDNSVRSCDQAGKFAAASAMA